MTNKERYKEDIFNIACAGDTIAFDIHEKKPVGCHSINCSNCLFNDSVRNCLELVPLWCDDKYISEEDTSNVEQEDAMMNVDENTINHNAVRLIDLSIRGGADEEHVTELKVSAFDYIKGICDMANAMKEVLKYN